MSVILKKNRKLMTILNDIKHIYNFWLKKSVCCHYAIKLLLHFSDEIGWMGGLDCVLESGYKDILSHSKYPLCAKFMRQVLDNFTKLIIIPNNFRKIWIIRH